MRVRISEILRLQRIQQFVRFAPGIVLFSVVALIAVLLVSCVEFSAFTVSPKLSPSSQPNSLSQPAGDAESAPSVLDLLAANAGKIAFKSNRNGSVEVFVMDADGGNQQPLDPPELYDEAAKLESFSPQRDHEVVSRLFGDNYYIFVRDIRTGLEQQISHGLGDDYAPAWSPDGSDVVHVRQIGNTTYIRSMDIDSQVGQPLASGKGYSAKHPSWSPDGQQIVYWSDQGEKMQIWRVAADGSGARNISHSDSDDWDPVWIKAPIIQAQMPPTPTPGGPQDIGFGWAYDGCMLGVNAVDQQDGAVPLTRIRVQVKDRVIYDTDTTGMMAVRSFRQTIPLNLPVGQHEVLVSVWNSGYYSAEPFVSTHTLNCSSAVSTPIPSLNNDSASDLIVVLPSPEAANIFEAATRAIKMTEEAIQFGTATPLPPNVVTATSTATAIVVTNTPTPENEATRQYLNAVHTAEAVVTGTPTPLPPQVVTATPTPTYTPTSPPTPTPLPTVTPTATNTPVFVTVQPPRQPSAGPTPTPVLSMPEVLRGKILFVSNRDGVDEIFVINPDGTDIGKLTNRWPYDLAIKGEKWGENQRYMTFVREDFNGLQIFVRDYQFNKDLQVTRFGAGNSWDPVFAPDGWHIAFVSNESKNDEIYTINRDGSEMKRLTFNEWQWDRHPSWSPDGTEIVFWSNRTGRKQLYIMAADGSNVRLISDDIGDDWDPVWVK